jgi:hypothetical protein
MWGKGVGGYRYGIHVYVNGKMRSVETIPGMGGGEDKGEWWRGWIQAWYIWFIVKTFVNVTM